MKLSIGNRNYSSWSMRPGVRLAQARIEHQAVVIRFDAFTAESQFKRAVAAVSLAVRVPVLKDGDLVVWDASTMRSSCDCRCRASLQTPAAFVAW